MAFKILDKEQAAYVKRMTIERVIRLGGDREQTTRIADKYFNDRIGRMELSISSYADDITNLMNFEGKNVIMVVVFYKAGNKLYSTTFGGAITIKSVRKYMARYNVEIIYIGTPSNKKVYDMSWSGIYDVIPYEKLNIKLTKRRVSEV